MEFEAYRERRLRDLAPVGPVETALAERIVKLSWQLKEAEARETEVLNDMIEKETSNPLTKLSDSLRADGVDLMGDDPEVNPELAFGRALAKDFAGDSILERLSIAEERIQDELFKAMDEFRRLKSLRNSRGEKGGNADCGMRNTE